MTSEPTTKADDLDLIKRTLREIIENKSQGHSATDRIEAIKLLHQLISS
jgi:hypothetical protein